MKVAFVDLKAQYQQIKPEIDQALAGVLGDCAFIAGKYAASFETEYADFIGSRHCIGMANGTDALFAAMACLGIGPGDEVITAANTFIASAEGITRTGAEVVFVDNDPDFYNLDTGRLEAAITARTKAILPVHLYGQPCDIGAVMEIARKHDLLVIEDAAQAHGAKYHGRNVGTFGNAACYSFYPGKNLGAYGDAGCVVTDDDDLEQKLRSFANHGRHDHFHHHIEGVNSRLDGFQAAVLSVKLKHLEAWTDARIAAARRYDEGLRDVCVVPQVMDGVRHVFHLYVIRVANRDELREHLQRSGIATGIHYPVALPFLPAYQRLGHRPEDFPVAHRQMTEIVSLPMHGDLTDDQIDLVIEKVREVAEMPEG